MDDNSHKSDAQQIRRLDKRTSSSHKKKNRSDFNLSHN